MTDIPPNSETGGIDAREQQVGDIKKEMSFLESLTVPKGKLPYIISMMEKADDVQVGNTFERVFTISRAGRRIQYSLDRKMISPAAAAEMRKILERPGLWSKMDTPLSGADKKKITDIINSLDKVAYIRRILDSITGTSDDILKKISKLKKKIFDDPMSAGYAAIEAEKLEKQVRDRSADTFLDKELGSPGKPRKRELDQSDPWK